MKYRTVGPRGGSSVPGESLTPHSVVDALKRFTFVQVTYPHLRIRVIDQGGPSLVPRACHLEGETSGSMSYRNLNVPLISDVEFNICANDEC